MQGTRKAGGTFHGEQETGSCAGRSGVSVEIWGCVGAGNWHLTMCVVSVWQNTGQEKGLCVSYGSTSQILMCTQTMWGSCENVDSVCVGLSGARDSACLTSCG